MAKAIEGKLTQADHSPIEVGDNIKIITTSLGGKGEHSGKNKPKRPKSKHQLFVN